MEGAEMRALREALGWDKNELARRLFVHWRTIHRWENEEIPIRPSAALLLEGWHAARFPAGKS